MFERILLIGSGGREHALAAFLSSSPSCEKLWCAPGNPGIEQDVECVPLHIADHESIVRWCKNNRVTLVVIGPEQPLAAGLSDDLRTASIPVFGPSQAAAQIETSKGFSKDFMQRHAIPTAPYQRFTATERADALEYGSQHSLPVVVKYDGLAAGKGVVVADSHEAAAKAITDMYDGVFGSDGVVVEGFLSGEEVSVFVITDGTDYVCLAPAQDHKRIGEGDTGKNTGGMGAYAPVPIVTEQIVEIIEETIVKPTLLGLKKEGSPFVGCLFCGLMIDDGKVSVVEFNARFGDPETQAVLSVLRADGAKLFASAAKGKLDKGAVINIAVGYACNVVLASRGYPDAYAKGVEISGINEAEADPYVHVKHAGTKLDGGRLVTNGGRVLGVVATDATLEGAVTRAYRAVDAIEFEGKTYRSDIAWRALAAEKQ